MEIKNVIKKQLKNLVQEQSESHISEQGTYMVLQNLFQMKENIEKILSMKNHPNFPKCVTGEHAWAGDHVSTSKDDIEEVANFISNMCGSHDEDLNEAGKMQSGEKDPCWKGYHMVGKKMKDGKEVPNCVPLNENIIYEDNFGSIEKTEYVVDEMLNEAEYQGRKVQLGKIMQGDVKKFKVYVKNDKGKVVKVNFGFGGESAHGKRMVIKKNNPERRKSFRARMKCDNPGPRWKPRYWACKTW
jgi:hypothetical protein